MTPQGLVDRQPLGAGGADIVLVHGVEEGGPQHARQNGGLRRGQGHGGQDQGLQGGPESLIPTGEAAGREPAKVHGKQQDQQHGDPEIRQGDADLSDADQAGVDSRAASAGCHDADGQGDGQRQDGGHQGQGRRNRQPLGDQAADRHLVGIADAKLACQQVAEPGEVALDAGALQPHLLT
ncbi:hypothetical protein D3C86_1403640 [compost metagenome]